MLAAVALAAGCAGMRPADDDAAAAATDGLGARVLRGYIRPAVRDLHRDTARLASALRDYCARPRDTSRRTEVELRLGDVAGSWAAVEVLRFGPLVEQNRLEQFFFWPDPRGVLQRQMRGVLASADRTLLEEAKFRAQSVAVQGLPALEYVLHADDAPLLIAQGGEAGRFRCDYAVAVGASLERLAGEIESAWDEPAVFARELAHPAPENLVYRSSGEVATEVLKALSTALHVARDQKLQPALGEAADSARGALLPLHRSGLTTRYLSAGIAAMARLHEAARFGAALPPGSRWIDTGIAEELERVQQDLDALEVPMDRAVADASQRELLVHAGLLLANARAMVDEYLAPALGVNLGFNSLDGD
ncbi:MAG: imelysin family protein [Pseudomonadota bacterium]